MVKGGGAGRGRVRGDEGVGVRGSVEGVTGGGIRGGGQSESIIKTLTLHKYTNTPSRSVL